MVSRARITKQTRSSSRITLVRSRTRGHMSRFGRWRASERNELGTEMAAARLGATAPAARASGASRTQVD